MQLRRAFTMLITIGLLFALAAPASAQDATGTNPLTLSTPYTAVAVEPGHTVTFDLNLSAPQGELVTFDLTGVPDGWTATLKGGGFVVDGVTYDVNHPPALRLSVAVPTEATDGLYALSVLATGASGRAQLDLALRVAAQVGGGVTMTSDFPALRGPSGVKFSYRLRLNNDTTQEVQFGLQTTAPDGWQVQARPSGQSLASTITIKPGESSTILVEATPPSDASAGSYEIDVTASGGDYTATAQLTAQITGSYAILLATQDQRLNANVVAGKGTDLQLEVFNTGSAPLENIQLHATAPSGWKTAFAPATVPEIAPGDSVPVTLTITPSHDAVAGDYRLSLSSQTKQAKDSIELRATVKTSAAWGLVGVGLIILVLAGLGIVFRRFGRR
ncbi:NPCBM-associated, NEW3 domain of alpha-galactosidase [bacterium BMS3Abin02]|nr:NPCBM-associated, NEW3 domain of alpha-galactosidase [bacterium BMS3Abin02]GBE22857.1 NPCBM-associated, NEW3 domain of alpha-galactosidase [bacterium BMS3Bbin01]